MEDSILTIFCCQHMLVLFTLLMKISRIPCSFHASLVCKDSFFSNQPAQCVVIPQSSITMTCITGTGSLDMNDGANGPILVPWALRKYQALYEDAKGLIMVAIL